MAPGDSIAPRTRARRQGDGAGGRRRPRGQPVRLPYADVPCGEGWLGGPQARLVWDRARGRRLGPSDTPGGARGRCDSRSISWGAGGGIAGGIPSGRDRSGADVAGIRTGELFLERSGRDRTQKVVRPLATNQEVGGSNPLRGYHTSQIRGPVVNHGQPGPLGARWGNRAGVSGGGISPTRNLTDHPACGGQRPGRWGAMGGGTIYPRYSSPPLPCLRRRLRAARLAPGGVMAWAPRRHPHRDPAQRERARPGGRSPRPAPELEFVPVDTAEEVLARSLPS